MISTLPNLGLLLVSLSGVAIVPLVEGQETTALTDQNYPPVSELFSGKRIVPLEIEIGPAETEALKEDPRKDVVAVIRSGTSRLTNAVVHLKGRASFRDLDDKPSFTITFDKFDRQQRFLGLTKIHLNNSVEDPSYLNERVGSELFRRAGIPAARAAHAKVSLNGRALGLYVLKEGFTEEFLAGHFRAAQGNLYENAPTDDDPSAMTRISGQGPGDQSDLKSLLDAAAEPDHANRWERLEREVDLNSFFSFMAMELMLSHRDGYCLAGNNYRLYRVPQTNHFVFIPHGMDQLLGRPDLPLRAQMGGVVARAVMEMPKGRRLYLERVAELFQKHFRAEALTNEVNQYLPLLRAELGGEARRDFDHYTDLLNERISRRAANLAKQLREPELKPLAFNRDVATLTGWRPVDIPAGGRMERTKAPDGRATLHISAGPVTSASWRTRVLLGPGKYRFEAMLRTKAVTALPFGKNKGAGLRVSEVKQTVFHQTVGDTDWKKLSLDFELAAPETETELNCELRASGGEAWYDVESLRLVRGP